MSTLIQSCLKPQIVGNQSYIVRHLFDNNGATILRDTLDPSLFCGENGFFTNSNYFVYEYSEPTSSQNHILITKSRITPKSYSSAVHYNNINTQGALNNDNQYSIMLYYRYRETLNGDVLEDREAIATTGVLNITKADLTNDLYGNYINVCGTWSGNVDLIDATAGTSQTINGEVKYLNVPFYY